MFRDAAYVVIAVSWAFINYRNGDSLQATVWFTVLFYAATNLIETKLRGSKYDY